ncbi:MAG: VOC family protein [Planctomycetales bacterium]|nr:VOC family protein [Planctomycetales bacterium]
MPTVSIHLSGMHHTGIVVRDLAAMERFYVGQLGLTKLKEIDSIAPPGGNHTGVPDARRKLLFLELTAGGHQIELVHYLSPPASPGGLDKHQLGAMHICFTVDDIEAVYAQLSAQGVQFATEPKYSEVDGRRIGVVYAQDPEGNWLEFIGGKL